MQYICVYCASSTQIKPVYFETADRLGKILAKEGIHLVYGGGSNGLMGQIADSALASRRKSYRHNSTFYVRRKMGS